jgi:hypothetical protein
MEILRDRFFIAIAAILLVGGYHAVAVHRTSRLKAEVAALRAKVARFESSASTAAYVRLPLMPRQIPQFRPVGRGNRRNAWRVPFRERAGETAPGWRARSPLARPGAGYGYPGYPGTAARVPPATGAAAAASAPR